MSTTVDSLSDEKLQALVRQLVREELRALLRMPARSVLEDWRQEGPEDPAGDELALRDALEVIRQHDDDPDAWMSWEDFEAELDRAEAAGELPS